jgi:hypothetical protein
VKTFKHPGLRQRNSQVGAGLPHPDLRGGIIRFLANENVTSTTILALRQDGHDVLSVKESMRSEPDDVILSRAQSEERIVVTHDKDFGELAFRSRPPASCGIILFGLSGSGREADNERIVDAPRSRADWAAHLSVVTDSRIRMRPLPGAREREKLVPSLRAALSQFLILGP